MSDRTLNSILHLQSNPHYCKIYENPCFVVNTGTYELTRDGHIWKTMLERTHDLRKIKYIRIKDYHADFTSDDGLQIKTCFGVAITLYFALLKSLPGCYDFNTEEQTHEFTIPDSFNIEVPIVTTYDIMFLEISLANPSPETHCIYYSENVLLTSYVHRSLQLSSYADNPIHYIFYEGIKKSMTPRVDGKIVEYFASDQIIRGHFIYSSGYIRSVVINDEQIDLQTFQLASNLYYLPHNSTVNWDTPNYEGAVVPSYTLEIDCDSVDTALFTVGARVMYWEIFWNYDLDRVLQDTRPLSIENPYLLQRDSYSPYKRPILNRLCITLWNTESLSTLGHHTMCPISLDELVAGDTISQCATCNVNIKCDYLQAWFDTGETICPHCKGSWSRPLKYIYTPT